MRTPVALGLLLAAALFAPEAAAADLTWVVMPVRAAHPPPRDPTLLRLSVPLAKTIDAAVSGAVRLAKRDERDDRCRDDGWRCPDEIAELLGVDRVISMQLPDAHDRVRVFVFGGRRGVIAKTDVTCDWDEGRLDCDREALSKFMKGLSVRALGAEEVFAAFEGLDAKLRGCLGEGPGRSGAKVRFMVRASGQAHQVRVEPRKLQRKAAYACMARAVEGLEVAPFSGPDAGPFTFALPDAPPASAP